MTYRGFRISLSTCAYPIQVSYAIHRDGEECSAAICSGTVVGAFASLDAAIAVALTHAQAWINKREPYRTAS